MRTFLSLLLIVSALVVGPGAAYGELMCPDPIAGTPKASPVAEIPPTGSFPEDGGQLTVFAAASLTDAFHDIADVIMEQHPGMSITIETGGSQSLVTQLEEGASADVLATADTSTMDRAVAGGLITGAPVLFTGNRLVIVTPPDNPAGIQSLDDLASDGVRLVVANPEVPAGRYATAAFCAYAGMDAAPDGFINSVNSNIVSEETDVRFVLTKVQLGEADAGVMYASDATASELSGVGLNVIEFPEGLPIHAGYPIASVEGGDSQLANAFIAFVTSDEGQVILQKYGFE